MLVPRLIHHTLARAASKVERPDASNNSQGNLRGLRLRVARFVELWRETFLLSNALRLEGNDPATSSSSSNRPDFPSEPGPLFRWSGVNHRDGVADAHCPTRITLYAHNGVHPLAERPGSFGPGWIVLVRGPAESRAFECVSAADVAGPTRPD
jgi:hypothetical protein